MAQCGSDDVGTNDAPTAFLYSVMNGLDGIDYQEDITQSSDPFNRLSTEITRLVETVRQGNDLLRRKKEVRKILYNTLRAEIPGPIDLYLVGSSLNGLGTKTSDIDLCLVMNNFGPGFCHYRVAVPMLRLVEKIFSKICKYFRFDLYQMLCDLSPFTHRIKFLINSTI